VKTRAKILVACALLPALLVLAWTATFLYWDFKIRGAIRTYLAESVGTGYYLDHMEPGRTLKEAGCRTFPYLVSALETPGQQGALTFALDHLLTWRVTLGQLTGEESVTAMDVMEQARIRPGDSPEEQRRKAVLVREWWAARRQFYHQWWRVWSSNCNPR
jgi:hypothetical protein